MPQPKPDWLKQPYGREQQALTVNGTTTAYINEEKP